MRKTPVVGTHPTTGTSVPGNPSIRQVNGAISRDDRPPGMAPAGTDGAADRPVQVADGSR